METDKLIRQRFSELEKKAEMMAITQQVTGGSRYVDSRKFREWGTSVLNLLQGVFGENSVHYQRFYEHFKSPGASFHFFQDC
jgi:hypothetical protein